MPSVKKDTNFAPPRLIPSLVEGFNTVASHIYLILFPVLILIMGFLGLGLGMIISSMVTKYRDLKFLLNFGVQLLMYLSAVMYPISLIGEKFHMF